MNWTKYILYITLITLSSCGIYDFRGTNIPEDVQTFSVGFFNNEADLVNPSLSIDFTEKLKTKFQTETQLGCRIECTNWCRANAIHHYGTRRFYLSKLQ